MPTYVYECKSCEVTFEREQRITEDAIKDCPSCGGIGTVRRLIQPIAVMFKGEGFHINDYASSTQKAAAKESEDVKSAPPVASPEAKTEPAPAETKPEPASSGPVAAPSAPKAD